eukprot:Gb_06747 [translate_table: standard]
MFVQMLMGACSAMFHCSIPKIGWLSEKDIFLHNLYAVLNGSLVVWISGLHHGNNTMNSFFLCLHMGYPMPISQGLILTCLHNINGTVYLHKSAYGDSFMPTCINVKRTSRGYGNGGDHIILAQQVRRIGDTNVGRRCRILPTVQHLSQRQRSSSGMKVYALSDLHTDYPENMAWVKRLSTTAYKTDILIIAGDVAEKFENFVSTMSVLKERFKHVFFVPGNHDIWCRGKHEPYLDSVDKLNALLEACSRLGITTEPKIINGVGIVPLFSWYHQSFDKEKDITGFRIPSLKMVIRSPYIISLCCLLRVIIRERFICCGAGL